VVFVNTDNPDILDVFNSSFARFSDRKVYYPALYMVSQCNTNVIGAYEHEVRVCAKFKSHLANKIQDF